MSAMPRSARTARGRFDPRSALLPALLFLSAAPVAGDPLGMVSDNASRQVSLFNAERDAITASLAAAPGHVVGDCALSSSESLGFATGSGSEIAFIEIEPALGITAGPNELVPISNLGVDLALSPDDAFLVLAGGGALQQPLSVVDTARRAEVATARPFYDHTSVEFCDDGTLLITTTFGRQFNTGPDNAVYDATIDRAGGISLGGGRVSSGAQPNNSTCAPGSRAAVLLDRDGGLTSFILPEMLPAARLRTRGTDAAVAAVFSRDGTRLFVRTTDTVEAFDFDPVTGAMKPDWVQPAPGSLAYYGMDQIALHPLGHKLYIDGGRSVLIFDPASGLRSGVIATGDATGICFANAARQERAHEPARNTRPVEPPAP